MLGFAYQGQSQDFLLQGWYWDYPKTANGALWADTLEAKAQALADAGFTHVWLPPLSRASFGNNSNGYDPKDLYDLGEFGLGATGFGSRADLDALVTVFDNVGMKAVADVIYNHRDGGKKEENPAVAGWIRNMTFQKIENGDQPFPSDRFDLILPIGGSTPFGAGTYFIKIASKSEHPNFFNKPYNVYIQTNTVGFQELPAESEVEPNGGGQCGEANNAIQLGVDMEGAIDGIGCKIDEFALTVNVGDFDAAGDTLEISIRNRNVGGLGDYSDHTIVGLFYTGQPGDHESALIYRTFTDFEDMPSGRGGMNYLDFKPNGNPTQLAGDEDAMLFFYDYDQNVTDTRDSLFAFTKWLWEDVGIRGFRMDAVKHFPRDFVGDLFDYLHDNGINPDLAVGENFDGNAGVLNTWINDVLANMDTDTKNVISPRIFDFTLRSSLKNASDLFEFDVRNVFNESLVDAQGTSPFNSVTFLNNHDFRHPGEPVENDPILGYAYILTNNQLGIPTVFYTDYYNLGLKPKIDSLMQAHKNHIFGATSRDYLSRFSTPYSQSFSSGFDHTTLFYQLSGMPSERDVLVAINYAGESLNMTHGVNISSMNLAVGDTLVQVAGSPQTEMLIIDGSGAVSVQLPSRSYGVWVKGSVFETAVVQGWNMVSLPGQALTKTASSLYPNAVQDPFIFSGTYQSVTEMEPCVGYWLNFPAAETISIPGSALDSCEIDLASGWNMVGGPSCKIAVEDITDEGGIISGSIFGFAGSYVPVDTLEPGQAYWVNTNQAGQIKMKCDAATKTVGLAEENRQNAPGNAGIALSKNDLDIRARIQLSDAAGATQILYWTVTNSGAGTFILPPVPPAGIFDARFSEGRFATHHDEFEIEFQGKHFPMKLRFSDIDLDEKNQLLIQQMAGTKVHQEDVLAKNRPIIIRDPKVNRLKISRFENIIPEEFLVEQNYPNPFNPTTEIRFSLPDAAEVTVEVYNPIGQLIRTLFSGRKEAGYHSVIWDGTDKYGADAASGIYLYRIATGAEQSVRKMVLLR